MFGQVDEVMKVLQEIFQVIGSVVSGLTSESIAETLGYLFGFLTAQAVEFVAGSVGVVVSQATGISAAFAKVIIFAQKVIGKLMPLFVKLADILGDGFKARVTVTRVETELAP
jgi:hypothetical protein